LPSPKQRVMGAMDDSSNTKWVDIVTMWFLWCIGVVLLGVVTYISLSMYNDHTLKKRALTWPEVSANIIATEVVESKARRRATRQIMIKTYEYAVDGITYSGKINEILDGEIGIQSGAGRSTAQRLVVRFNPAYPGEAIVWNRMGVHRDGGWVNNWVLAALMIPWLFIGYSALRLVRTTIGASKRL